MTAISINVETAIKDETFANQLVVSPSVQAFDSASDDSDRLKLTIESISPRVSAMLEANEAALDYLMSNELHEDTRINSIEANQDDGLAIEWKRLSIIEQSLSDELDLSDIGWKLTDELHNSSKSDQEQASSTSIGHSYDSLIHDVSIEANTDQSPSLEDDSLRTMNEDSHNDHSSTSFDMLMPFAEALQAQFCSDDLGLPTIHFLSNSDIQLYQETPLFENHQNTGYSIEQRVQAAQSSLLFIREYILPLSLHDLNSIFAGIANPTKEIRCVAGQDIPESSVVEDTTEDGNMPIRSVTIRVRPDTLCGAVMDAVHASIQNLGGEITKRQGGHLKATIPSLQCVARKTNDGSMLSKLDYFLPSIRLDIQLVSKKRSRESDRTLLIRSFKEVIPIQLSSSFNTHELNIDDLGFNLDTNEHRLIEAATSIQKLLGSRKSRVQKSPEPTYSASHHGNSNHTSSWRKRAHSIAQELRKSSKSSQDTFRDKATELMYDVGFDYPDLSTDESCLKTRHSYIPILEYSDLPFFVSSKLFIMSCLYELESRGLSFWYVHSTSLR